MSQSALVHVAAALSGCFVMTIEVLGGRLLSPYFGSSVFVWGALITVFMAFLALGYLAGGRWSQRSSSLKGLGLLLVLEAALAVPMVFLGDPVLEALSAREWDPRTGSLLASAILFGLPTLVSGMVSPYAVRLLATDLNDTGRAAGGLYAVSTIGSALGTLLTSFWAVLLLDIHHIILLACGLTALMGAMLMLRDRAAGPDGSMRAPPPRHGPGAALLLPLVAAALVAGFMPTSARAVGYQDATQVIASHRSLYRNVLVTEGGGHRCLKFGRLHAFQSCMDLRDPQRLVLSYTQAMVAAVALHPAPQRLLLIGLGAGSIAQALHELKPDLRLDVVELDPAVVRVAHDHFGLVVDDRLQVHTADGRSFVRSQLRRGQRYDLVLVDAFEKDYIPEHLLTREFLEQLGALLSEDGLVIANTWASTPLSRHESATYAAVFGATLDLMSRSGNRILIARRGGFEVGADLPAAQRALFEETPALRAYGVDAADLATRLIVTNPVPGTPALSDRFAPANLLLVGD